MVQRTPWRAAPAVLLAGLALVACGRRPTAPGGGAGPSVLLVVLDSLHARHASAWGHARATTPRLDRLAGTGVRFSAAYSQSSWTLPSVASLLSGLEQERHGLRHIDACLGPEAVLLPELFAAGGWRTRAIVQTPVLGSARGLTRGFEQYEVLGFGSQESERAVELARTAFEQARGERLFCYLHLAPPHMPYQPPAPFAGRFTAGAPEDNPVDGSIAACRAVHELRLAPDHPDVLRLVALYDEHVAYADDLLGRVLDSIEDLPAARDLLVIVTSDHGEAFLQHGQQGHNTQVYEEMLHVPLVVAGCGASQLSARTVATPVSLLDLLPTLVQHLDLPAPRDPGQGRSLAGWLAGEDPPASERELFFSSRYRRRRADLELGLRAGDLKLVLSGASNRVALYDLARDPGETIDISASRPEQRARLEQRLRRWYAERAPDAARVPQDSPESEGLRELGYLGD